MAGQCAVITLILVLIAAVFFRSKRSKWAWLTCPLAVLPVSAVLAAEGALILTGKKLELMPACCVIMTAVIISCTWLGICSMKMISKRRTRAPYLAAGVGFNIMLGLILVNHYIKAFTP